MRSSRFVSAEAAELHSIRRHVLRRWSAVFADPAMEELYNASQLPHDHRNLTTLMGLFYVGIVLFGYNDLIVVGRGGVLTVRLAARMSFLLTALPLFVKARAVRNHREIRVLGVLWFLVAATFAVLVQISHPPVHAASFPVSAIFLFLTYLMLPNRIVVRTTLTAALSLLWILILWTLRDDLSVAARINITVMILAVNTVGAVVACSLSIERRIQIHLLKRDQNIHAREHEILMGAHIQRTLLLAPPPHNVAGLSIAVQTLPSQNIDGDFYDFFPLSPAVLDLVVGDVMGKGVSAALVGAAVKMAYMRSMVDMDNPCEVLPALSQIVRRTEMQLSGELISLDRFVTMYSCRINTNEAALEYIDCGHTYIAHYSHREKTAWIFKGLNMPIGFAEQQPFREQRVPLEEGDLLFWYSDGVTEGQNGEGDHFGESRIMHYLIGHAREDPHTALQNLLSLLFSFTTTANTDDITCIIVRYEGSTPGAPGNGRRGGYQDRLRGEYRGCLRQREENSVYPVTPELMEKVRTATERYLNTAQRPEQFVTEGVFAIHEAIANIWVHVYHGTAAPSETVAIRFHEQAGWWYTTIRYRGDPFRIDHTHTPDTSSFQENGYGLQIIHHVMDSTVLCQGLHNELKLVLAKRIPSETGEA